MPNALSTVLIILAIVALLACAVSWFLLFKKACYFPLKLFIPFYGQFLQFRIAGSSGLFFGALAACGSLLLMNRLTVLYKMRVQYAETLYMQTNALNKLTTFIVTAILLICLLVFFRIICSVRLARLFGKKPAFALGLIFVAPVFLCLLAFGNAEYNGTMGDYGIKEDPGSWTCKNCGAKNEGGRESCSVCGHYR